MEEKKNQPSVIKNFLLKNLKDNHSAVQIQLQEQRRNKKKKNQLQCFAFLSVETPLLIFSLNPKFEPIMQWNLSPLFVVTCFVEDQRQPTIL
jgi:hypothetical protein